jgi:hypothetical protein
VDCLDEAALDDFVGGRLAGADLASVEAHIDVCPDCRDVVVVLAGAIRAAAPSSGAGRRSDGISSSSRSGGGRWASCTSRTIRCSIGKSR